MKVIPQYKVLGPYNYDMVMNVTKKIPREKIAVVDGKMHLVLKIKFE